ncbi:MAG: YitT family protein [Lachnospiraceae bacterium]|nr:YitT family protein [Lachnospiraceae bacterium]
MHYLIPGKSPVATELKRAIAATLGGLLYSLGVNLFIVPLGLYNGGLMGYCQLIRTLLITYLHITPPFDIAGILYFLANIPIMIISWIKLDKKFVFRAILNIAVVTLFLSIIPVKAVIQGDIITNCLVGGVITGAGTGVSLWAATPGGGTDLIGLMLIKKGTRFSVGRLNLLVDVVLYVICLLMFNIQVAIYSIVFSAVSTFVIDKLHQQNINVQALIVTDNPSEELRKALIQKLDRGITKLPAEGGYSGKDKTAFMIVLSKYEAPELVATVKEHDPDAFITFNEGTRIFGNFERRL